jgi:(2S)-methylsuccinyl-CoA dehydrogenase
MVGPPKKLAPDDTRRRPSMSVREDDARLVLEAGSKLLAESVLAAKRLTADGARIDDHQVITERVAYAATEAVAAHEVLAELERWRAEGKATPIREKTAIAAVGELMNNLCIRLSGAADDLEIGDAAVERSFPASVRSALRRTTSEALLRELGANAAATRGANDWALDETHEQVRDQVRQFASEEIAPHAEHIHRHDETIPESFIEKMAELGFFGLSIPEAYGGVEMGNLAMILTTEELSRASLAAAGSLITRPEILTKALMGGGTEAQKMFWLPKLASGEIMAGISVTEPDIGSDVASVKCRATRGKRADVDGWLIDGPKAWCTFAGRANVLAVLLRTDPDVSKGAKGLSLFVVPKPSTREHAFEFRQPGGGRLVGKADATPGYRGMHSYTLNFENWFVPADHLVGEEKGVGRGFYLQMAGFAAGRLQTGGRGCGLAQAALEETARYVVDRKQFEQPISEFQLTQYTLGRMAAQIAGARAITYAAARAFDEDERAAAPLAAQAKLLACDVAVSATQAGQLMHGGWGYAEEYPISRYVVDATVLPIFEGVKPILELKVIGKAILGA